MRMKHNLDAIRRVASAVVLFAVAVSSYAALVPGWDRLSVDRAEVWPGNVKPRLESSGCFLIDADLAAMRNARRVRCDFKISMDLRRQVGFAFDFYCDDALQFTGFSVYLRSGKGWYLAPFAPMVGGKWHRIVVKKSAFDKTEGQTEGLGKIDVLRIAGRIGGEAKVKIGIANLLYVDFGDPVVGVVCADSCERDSKFKSQHGAFVRFATATASALEDAGANAIVISDADLDRETVQGMKLLVFPYNPSLPAGKRDVVEGFVAGGGKIFACHQQDMAVLKALGMDMGRYRNRNWRSSSETPSKEHGGFYLPHVWRSGIEDSRRQAYNLLVQALPSWKAAFDAAKSKAEAQTKKDIEWVAGLPPKKGEWRAFWCHSARGLGGRHDWDSSIALLKRNGFNAILPNLAWGGVAYYRSSVLPVHESVQERGDAFDECIAACRKHGVECHVWKVCWKMGSGTDGDFAKRMSAEGRVQVGYNGKKEDMWLCPSHPENLKFEENAFLELAKKGPDGIHFDYIR